MRSTLVFFFTVHALGCGDVVAPSGARPGEQTDGDAAPPPLELPFDAGPLDCDAHFDPCSPSPCHPEVECTAEGWRAECGACPEGTIGDGWTCDAPPRLEISELDYDQPGADDREFVELWNAGSETVGLSGLTLVMINGESGEPYKRVSLEPLGELAPGELALVAMPLVDAPSGVKVLTTSASAAIQNGPDAISIVDSAGFVIDAVAYGGAVSVIAQEHHTDAVDDGPASLSRLAPGAAFVASCLPSPGLPNASACEGE